jgi:hypothetical protein
MQTARSGGRSTKQDQINAIVTELQQITKRLDAIEAKGSKAPAKKKRHIGHSLGISNTDAE